VEQAQEDSVTPNDPTLRRMTTHLKSTLDRAVDDYEPNSGALGMMEFSEAMKDSQKVVLAFQLNSKAQHEGAKKVIGEIR
jgi:hypothetical protein